MDTKHDVQYVLGLTASTGICTRDLKHHSHWMDHTDGCILRDYKSVSFTFNILFTI